MRLAEKLSWSLLSSGLLMIVLAVASHRTGIHAQVTGGRVNTHAPATWILATFGLVFVINSLALFSWVNEQKAELSGAASAGDQT
jgi:thiosulfate reductase cytochrome b subunit